MLELLINYVTYSTG